ncbi:NTP transferase domain-containing protein [Hamadaea sp. NPDC051192]|uniref:nucleotidyltransferase family protein n=1 Tax=Hamadaea sp. NPDC051192 TaxID=3154940 RepID=UPI003414DFCA
MAELAAIVLAAGEGSRLRPLTTLRPKALCPVGNIPMLDRALALLDEIGLAGPDRVAVNACWLGDQVAEHVGDRAHVSVEKDLLGSAGSVGHLRDWVDGRPVLVMNADAYFSADVTIAALVEDWDGERLRMLGQRHVGGEGEFGAYDFAGMSLLPAATAASLPADHGDLVRLAWRPAEAAGTLDVIRLHGLYLDCGTPRSYLHANLLEVEESLIAPDAVVTGEVRRSVVGAGAIVHGDVHDCVVWPGSQVTAGEQLSRAVRAQDLTVRVESRS